MIRWRRKPMPTGLAGVCCGEQGSHLYENKEIELATTQKTSGGWFWYSRLEDEEGGIIIPMINTWYEPVATEKQAKTDARAYVRKHLKR